MKASEKVIYLTQKAVKNLYVALLLSVKSLYKNFKFLLNTICSLLQCRGVWRYTHAIHNYYLESIYIIMLNCPYYLLMGMLYSFILRQRVERDMPKIFAASD